MNPDIVKYSFVTDDQCMVTISSEAPFQVQLVGVGHHITLIDGKQTRNNSARHLHLSYTYELPNYIVYDESYNENGEVFNKNDAIHCLRDILSKDKTIKEFYVQFEYGRIDNYFIENVQIH